MSFRKILVPLTGVDADRSALAEAFAVARRHDALVDAVFLRFDQPYEKVKFPEYLPGGLFDEVAEMVADEDDAEKRARQEFDEARIAAGIAVTGEGEAPAGSAAARWIGSRPAARIVRDAPLADLIVLGHSARGDRRLVALRGAVLTASGRPLLLAPRKPVAPAPGPVVIAWNGGAHAARAVAAALPFLKAATRVHVLTARTYKTRSSEGERLAEYLTCQGLQAEVAVLSPAGAAVGAVLLRRADELGARLVVMGGTGRTRLRDFLFGGVTSHVFAHAELPVLIAH